MLGHKTSLNIFTKTKMTQSTFGNNEMKQEINNEREIEFHKRV